jgi:hypothetical protein
MARTLITPTTLLLAAFVGGLALPACGGDAAKKGDATKTADAKKPEGDAKKPDEKKPAALAFKKLDKLPLEIEVPADAEVMDASADAPNATVSSGDWSINVSTVTEAYASDFAAAKAEIEKDPNKFKAFTKEEKTEGGWHFEYELASMMDQSPLYGVQIRKTIDGKGYECGRNDRNVANRDAIAKMCQTLKKSG